MTAAVIRLESDDAAEQIDAAFAEAEQLIRDRHQRAEALQDLNYFAREYASLELGVPQFHVKAYEVAQRNTHVLWLAPVGHGKSTSYGFVLPLWKIARDPSSRGLLACRSLNRAVEEVGRVREYIEKSERYRRVFGIQPSEVWRRESFQVQRPKVLKEATMTAMGLLGNVENWRGEWIIADDIIDITSSTSEAMRRLVSHWFANTLTKRLEPGGTIYVVGSSWHSQDQYHRIAKSPGWQTQIDRALLPDGTALWPERWPVAKLIAERDNMPGGQAAFEMRFQNNPIDESAARWDSSWIHYAEIPTKPDEVREFEKRIEKRGQGWDLASAATRRGGSVDDPDYCACVTGDRMADGTLVVRDFFRFRGDFAKQLDMVIQLADEWGPDVIAIESNMYQVALPQQLVRETRLPVVPSLAKGNKEVRLDALAPHFKGGRIRFDPNARGLDDFVWEFKAFPHGVHDDLLDALWHLFHELMGRTKSGVSIRVR